jgi:4'-phosphopantetheinyl transferase
VYSFTAETSPSGVPSAAAWRDVTLPSRLAFRGRAEVHVWATCSHWHGKPSVDRSLAILSEQERQRASKFALDRDQHEYLVAHAMLRTMLARYLRCAPEDVAFANGHHGKPVCQNDLGYTFNLAHGQGAIVLAVTAGHDVGIDVEQVRPVSDIDGLARRFFAPDEVARLSSFDETQRDRAFFELWTRKEAYLKCLGLGLSHPLDSFEVTFGLGAAFRLRGGEPGPWSLFHLAPFPNSVGALAVRADAVRLYGGVVRNLISPTSC